MVKKKITNVLSIRVTPSERAILDKAAKKAEEYVTAYIRDRALLSARIELEESGSVA